MVGEAGLRDGERSAERRSPDGPTPAALVVCLVVLLLAGACSGARRQRRPTPPPERIVGRVGIEFPASPDRAVPEPGRNRELVFPRPLETPLPQYPEKLLQKGARATTINLRLIVEADGTVKEVTDTPWAEPPEGGPENPFRAAAVEAVRKWRFVPARILTYEEGSDLDGDGSPDYRVVVSSVEVRYYLDVAFTFEVVAGTPRVQAEPRPPEAGRQRH